MYSCDNSKLLTKSDHYFSSYVVLFVFIIVLFLFCFFLVITESVAAVNCLNLEIYT